jgi:hypothetical protein
VETSMLQGDVGWRTMSCAEIAMGHIQPIDAGDLIG